MSKKIKIMTISDMPFAPSGVGTQTRYIIEGMLKTGKYQFVSLGGAMKHPNHNPIKTEEWGEDWVTFPVDGYGSQEIVRSILRQEKPDILYFMTDPRFWGWLWEIENEIRPLMPMVYYHVWDNYPYPDYNKKFYESNDLIATISKVTDDIVKTVAPSVKSIYLPHAVNTESFRKYDEEQVTPFVMNSFGDKYDPDKFIFFWNNRNARRKQSGSLIFWFNDFLKKVGKDKACLVMHTEVKDQHGQDLQAIIENLGLTNSEVLFSQNKVSPDKLALIYNMVDCTVNISDAEGFGLATLESLSCGTPIIVSMTGGLQEQIRAPGDAKEYGVGIYPASKAIIGSQDIPWIYEDRLSGDDVVDAMETMYYMDKEERTKLGLAGRKHVMENYNFETFNRTWVETLVSLHEEEGSWETRKETQRWILEEMVI
jgi:glycosyltransferase involved in cell wall biosynthesis